MSGGMRSAWLGMVALACVFGALIAAQYWLAVEAAAASQRAAGRAAQKLVEQQLQDRLRTRAAIITESQAFVGYVAQALGGALPGMPVDTDSILDLLEERSTQLGLAGAAVLNGQGDRIVGTRALSAQRDYPGDPLVLSAVEDQGFAAGLWREGGRLLMVGIQPLAEDGSSDGFLLVALPVDRELAEAVAQVSGLHVAIVARGPDGPRMFASSLDEGAATEAARLLGTGAVPRAVTVAGERYDITTAPLLDTADAQWVALASAAAARRGALPQVLPALAMAVLALGVLVALASGWRSQVVRPALALNALIERAGSGDLHLHAAPTGAAPIAMLARTFNLTLERLTALRELAQRTSR